MQFVVTQHNSLREFVVQFKKAGVATTRREAQVLAPQFTPGAANSKGCLKHVPQVCLSQGVMRTASAPCGVLEQRRCRSDKGVLDHINDKISSNQPWPQPYAVISSRNPRSIASNCFELSNRPLKLMKPSVKTPIFKLSFSCKLVVGMVTFCGEKVKQPSCYCSGGEPSLAVVWVGFGGLC